MNTPENRSFGNAAKEKAITALHILTPAVIPLIGWAIDTQIVDHKYPVVTIASSVPAVLTFIISMVQLRRRELKILNESDVQRQSNYNRHTELTDKYPFLKQIRNSVDNRTDLS